MHVYYFDCIAFVVAVEVVVVDGDINAALVVVASCSYDFVV